jgi:hypothetical protein
LRDVNRSWQLVASESSTLREFITQVVLGNKQVEGHMTRLKHLALGGLAALAMTGVASSAYAIESGSFQYLPGASIGIPAGAAPPPGLYTGLETNYGPVGGMYGNYGGTGSGGPQGTQLGAFVDIVPVVWSTGWNVLGASYSVAVIQPFVTAVVGNAGGGTNACTAVPALGGLSPNSLCAWQEMFINTIFQPVNLSWNLGGGWFASAAFSFQAPEGSRYPGVANPDYWAYIPGAAISYLSSSWTLSANFAYLVYGPSAGVATNLGGTAFGNGYVSGQEITGDFTALYKLGKWSFGPVGYFIAQTTNDSAGGAGCGSAILVATGSGCGKQQAVAAGGLIGYDFGPVDVQVWVTDTFANQDDAYGWGIWSRVGFRLWAPEAPKPLVAKN